MIDLSIPEIKLLLPTLSDVISIAPKIQSELVSLNFSKDDFSPVGVADFVIQTLVNRQLMKYFPTDTIIAEEDAQTLVNSNLNESVIKYVRAIVPEATNNDIHTWLDFGRNTNSKRIWTLDPIDGTKGFLRGGQYAIALALVIEGKVQIGILGCPHWPGSDQSNNEFPGSILIAVRGKGAWLSLSTHKFDFKQLHVTDQISLSDLRILRSFEQSHTNVDLINRILKNLNIHSAPILMDSQVKYAVLASGSADLIIRTPPSNKPNYREKIWDIAAGSLIIEEAGGRVSDMNGIPLDFTTGRELNRNVGIIVSNSILHDKIIQIVKNSQDYNQ